jgi:GNAT superfamily N-acetyltransferase
MMENTRQDWMEPGFNLETDSQIVLTKQGNVVGYCEVWDILEPPVKLNLWLQLHPDYKHTDVGNRLLTWAEQRSLQALERTPGDLRVVMHSYVPAADEATCQIFRARGFKTIRHFWTMVLDLEGEPAAPVWPKGLHVRAMRRHSDEVDILKAVRETFKDHWGYVDAPFEEEKERWLHRLETDIEFDPSLWFLAMDGDEIAGISLCKWKAFDDPEIGWVNILGVRRPWRRRGVALALLQHSFREFYARGRCKIGLGVDALSLTGATRVYEKAGMRSDPRRELLLYEKELKPGREIRTQSLDLGGP